MPRIATALALMAVLLTGGCLVSSDSHVRESGVKVSSETLQQVEVGKTTEAWLRATLGEPTGESTVEGNGNLKLLRYTYSVEESGSGGVFLLFHSRSTKKRTTTTYFEITDGVVTRHWTEH